MDPKMKQAADAAFEQMWRQSWGPKTESSFVGRHWEPAIKRGAYEVWIKAVGWLDGWLKTEKANP